MLTLADDGDGFNVTQKFQGHYGLDTMRERVEVFDGQCTINSTQGHGTVVRVIVPLTTE